MRQNMHHYRASILLKYKINDSINASALHYRKSDTSASSSSQNKAPDSTLIGKKVEMKFKVNKKIKWFSGEINTYDEVSGKYGVYFPCDG